MVAPWREARADHFVLARGLLELAQIDDPSPRALGAAAVVGEFLVGAVKFLHPKVK